MTDQHLMKQYGLDNGLKMAVQDRSRHYYGGYWQVILEASCQIPVCRDFFDSDAQFEEACRLLGDQVTFSSRMEQMAVIQDQLEVAKGELLSRLEKNMLDYLSKDGFSKNFVQSELRQRLKKPLTTFRNSK